MTQSVGLGWQSLELGLLSLALLFSSLSVLLIRKTLRRKTRSHGAAEWTVIGEDSIATSSELRNTLRSNLRLRNRRNGGATKVASLIVMVPFVIIMLAASAVIPFANLLNANPVMKYEHVKVLQEDGDWGYWFEINGERMHANFCRDMGYVPPFYAGLEFEYLRVRDYGTCWSVNNVHPAYK